MLILQNILSQEIVQRLGWTLLHFIWQAAAVALILTILLKLLRKSTANLRYIFACLALALIVLLPIITIKLVPVSQPQTAAQFAPATEPIVLPIEELPEPETIVIAKPYQPESAPVVPAIPFKQRAVDTLEPALPYIVLGWLIGVFGLSIWHLGGWTQLQRLKRRMVKQVDSTLLNKLKALIQQLKVKQTVRLMESALVQIPTVVGWLRPVILLPASAITGLSTEQLEAIVAHELAHIKRFDYLINILQTVVEILGFYHPAVWWVSHKIRAERENCCDDIAVSISGDRLSYVGALASMEEIRAARGKLAVAATGGDLFRRICRLLGKDSTDNAGLSWVPAVTVILLIIALAIPTTLALTEKSNSLLTVPQAKLQVNDDIIATAQADESPTDNIPTAPVLATSPAPPDKDKAHVRIECFGVQIPTNSQMDRQTLNDLENLLGNKVSLRSSNVDVVLRQVAQATAAIKDESDKSKRVTEQQFNALVKMLDSKGCLNILTNPTIETVSGKTATIMSSQKVPLSQAIKAMPDGGNIIRTLNKNEYVEVLDLIQIIPHVLADGHITLEVEADLGSPKLPEYKATATPISSRQLSTQVHTNPGESLIIGGLTQNPPISADVANNTEKQAKEMLFILIPTIVNTDNESEKKTESAHKLKLLGLAVAMYADDNNDDLPGSIQELKPYLRDEQDFEWILNNVEYFDKGKSAQRNAAFIPIAYDSTMPEKADGTNVLFLDFSVRFLNTEEFEKLDLQRAEFLIKTWFLAVTEDFLENINHNADSADEAKELLKLKSELLAAADGSNQMSFIPPEHDVNLLLKAVRAHKDSEILASPQVLCLEDKTAEINVMNFETYYIAGYTEPNDPSEKPQPILERVEEGISMSLKPSLTPNKNIDMQFESEVTNILDDEERKFKGKAPYKPPKVQRRTQSTRYIAKDGDILLFRGNKIADSRDDRTERKELLILIKASTIGSSEQDKPAQVKSPALTEPPATTTKVITPPAMAKSRTERTEEDGPDKTKPATVFTRPDESDEPNEPMVTVNFKNVEMKTIIKKLSEWTGKIIIPTADSMSQKLTAYSPTKIQRSKAVEMIYSALRLIGYTTEQTDDTIFLKPIAKVILGEVPKISEDYPLSMVENKDQVVQKSFKLKYRSPSQMAQIILPLVNEYGYVGADEKTGTLVVIDTVKSLMHISTIIKQFDIIEVDEILTEIFEIKHGDPTAMVELLQTLLGDGSSMSMPVRRRGPFGMSRGGPPSSSSRGRSSRSGGTAQSVTIRTSRTPALLIPEPAYNWIIVKATAEDIKKIGDWIEKLDRAIPTLFADQPLSQIENKNQIVQKFFKLKNYSPSQMAQIVRPVLTKTGQTIPEERTNSLLVIDTAENLKRIEKIIEQYDVSRADKTVTEIFEIRNGDPVEIVEVLKKLINGRPDTPSVIKPDTASVIESSNGPILLIPEPQRKWIIAKASPENMKQIGQWIQKLDIKKSTIGLDPIDKVVYEQLEMIVDLSELAPEMSFDKVVKILENSVAPPLQIQPIWKDLLENAEVEQATPAGTDPLSSVKLRKALEILLTSVSSTGLPKLTYIVDDGVILIGTEGVLPPKKVHHIYDTSDLLATDAAKASPENMLKSAEQIKEGDVPLDVDKVKPRIIELQNSDVEQMAVLLRTVFTDEGGGGLSTEEKQKIVGVLYGQLTFEEVPGTNKLIVISKIPEAYEVIEQLILDLDRQNVSPENIKQITQSIDKYATRNNIGIDPVDKAVYEQLETIVDLSQLRPQMSFEEVVEILENSVEPPLQIQPIWKDLLENAEVEQVTPAGLDPLPHIKLRKALEILLTSVSSTGLPKLTYIVDDGVILIGTVGILPTKIVHQQESSQVQEKIDKLLDESEESMTPLEQVQKQLDELIKQQQAPKVTEPNLPPAPKVPLISNTFIDWPLIDALKSIAAAANVNIMHDETITGLVSCTLKDFTVETALDIILAGTPYVWKKTPHYYLVVSRAEPPEIIARMESVKKLSNFGKALLIYANDHDDKYPDSLFTFSKYMKWQDFSWVRQNAEYLASGKTLADRPDTPIAYDKTLLAQGKGTNVLYNDCHVGFEKIEKLKQLGISESEIMIETVFLSVSEDYLKDVGLDANTENFSDAWTRHLAAKYPAGPNGQPYGLFIDDLHVTFLLRAIQADHDSKAIVAPRVLTRTGTTAEMRCTTEEYNYISGYNEPNRPSDKPEPKLDKVEIGTRIWITPKLTDNNRNINLDLNLEMRRLEGIIEGKYKGKYPFHKPIVDVISAKMPCTIPEGKIMLIGGLKINEGIKKEPASPLLKDLPLIGAAFSSEDKSTKQKMLLILVKPITNPQQKATKLRPGQEDSEEHIRRLAEQLDKKINPPGKPRQ